MITLDEAEQAAWDRFAAAALVVGVSEGENDPGEVVARESARYADAMILERRRRQRPPPPRAPAVRVPDSDPVERKVSR